MSPGWQFLSSALMEAFPLSTEAGRGGSQEGGGNIRSGLRSGRERAGRLIPTPGLAQDLVVLVQWDCGWACRSPGPSRTWAVGRTALGPSWVSQRYGGDMGWQSRGVTHGLQIRPASPFHNLKCVAIPHRVPHECLRSKPRAQAWA